MSEINQPPAPPRASSAPPVIAIAGVVLVVIGAFGTWASVSADAIGFDVSAGGLDGDGVITLILGLIAGAVAFVGMRAPATWQAIVLAIAAAVIVLIAIYDMTQVGDAADGVSGIDVSIGWGLWATLLGGLVLAADAVRRFRG
jgi:hypothetical protein